MKLHIISAALPPQLDGIGDYTACLAAELARSVDVTVLTGAPTPAPIPGVRVETAFSAADPRSVWQLVDRVAADNPDWVLLQYNPFSYGRWGLNLHLPRVMRRIKRVSPGTRFALMVHEPFVPIISPQFAVMAAWQRWQLWSLGRCADAVFFSIEYCTKQFRSWFSGKPLVHLPVGSNIPYVPISYNEARKRLGIEDNTFIVGVFGTINVGRMLGQIREAAEVLIQSGYNVQMLYIGPHQDQFRTALMGINTVANGAASPEEVSKRFSAMDIYLVPYTDGISTRRTTFMVALQHGVATITTRGPLTDSILIRKSESAFLLADVDEIQLFQEQVLRLAKDTHLREQIARNGASLYSQEFGWPRVVQTLQKVLNG